jgi:hypothetical protein
MAGFLRGLGQAIEGGIKGWETGARWQQADAAEKERQRLRNEDVEMKAALKSLDTAKDPIWDNPNPAPSTPPPSPADIAAGATQAAPPPPPPQQALPPAANYPAPYYPERSQQTALPPVPGRRYNQEDAIQELHMPAAQAAQFADTRPPLTPAALPTSVPPALPPPDPQRVAALPPTDTQVAAATVAPPPQALPIPAKEEDPKNLVTVTDRFTGVPQTVPKSETRPMNEYDRAVARANIYRKYGKEQEASSVIQQYVAQHAQELDQVGRDAEMAGMSYLVNGDHRGLDALSAKNPMGVAFEMAKDDKGQVSFGLNPRGTTAPTVYIGPDGHMSTTPVYMGVQDVTTLLRGAATGNMAGAVSTIADLQSKFITMAQGRQATEASKAQVANAAANTRVSAVNAYNAYNQNQVERGYQPVEFGTFLQATGLPSDTLPGSLITPQMPGGTDGTGGGIPAAAADTVVGYGRYGQPPKPLTSMTMGEVDDFGKNVLIPATRNRAELGLAGTGKGTSAAGMYQITSETMREYAPKVLGANWRSMPFSVENQDKIAERIFNDNKGGNLQATWASLPNSAPGAYKNRTWADMRGEIAQREVGRGLPTSAQAAATTGSGLPSLTTPKEPVYAGGGQFDTPKKLEQEITVARAEAQQSADAMVQAARKSAADNGTQLSDEAATVLHRSAFNHAITDRMESYDNRDKERLADRLMPGSRLMLQGKPGVAGAYGGPNAAVRSTRNPFATGDLAKDKAFYQYVKGLGGQRKASPQVQEWFNQFANLKKLDADYARRIAQPPSKDRVRLAQVSVSGQ